MDGSLSITVNCGMSFMTPILASLLTRRDEMRLSATAVLGHDRLLTGERFVAGSWPDKKVSAYQALGWQSTGARLQVVPYMFCRTPFKAWNSRRGGCVSLSHLGAFLLLMENMGMTNTKLRKPIAMSGYKERPQAISSQQNFYALPVPHFHQFFSDCSPAMVAARMPAAK